MSEIREKVLAKEFTDEELQFAEALQNRYANLERLHIGEIAYTVRYIKEYRKRISTAPGMCRMMCVAA